jgi:hypothetical protein
VFQNRVLRTILGRKWDEVTGEWRPLHKEELNELYSSLQIKKNEMGGAHSMYVGEKRCIQGFGRET